GARRHVLATAGNAKATVRWVAPASNGRTPILKYVAISTAGAHRCSTSKATTRSCVVRGLADFATYRFRVAAVNAEGAGPLSKPSNAVRPMAPVAARLIGRWLGPPVPAQAPSCGSGYRQWQFTASGQ